MTSPLIIFIIAGEPSGDRLGASLMAGLTAENPNIKFHGVGGPLMQAQGLSSIFPMSDLSVMGLAEVLPKLPKILSRIKQAVKAVVDLKPNGLITIDSPDFCLRVARKVKAIIPEQKTIHYVAPTVWAWRPERAEEMSAYIDHVLALFPFEPPLMQAAGMSCDFVGHPIVADPKITPDQIAEFRQKHDLAENTRLISVLPGSRMGEVKKMGPVFRAVMTEILQKHPDLQYMIAVPAGVEKYTLETRSLWPGDPVFLLQSDGSASQAEHQKRVAFAASDLALAASGTVSLELAAAGTPMVIAYRFNWLTTRIIKRKILIDTATLVNILTDTLAVPEFLFEDCNADDIAACVSDLLQDQNLRMQQQDAAKQSMQLLGQGTIEPGSKAAQSVLQFIC